jgi:hypothetical protein
MYDSRITEEQIVPANNSYTFITSFDYTIVPTITTFSFEAGAIGVRCNNSQIYLHLTENTFETLREFIDMAEQEFYRSKDPEVDRRGRAHWKKTQARFTSADYEA